MKHNFESQDLNKLLTLEKRPALNTTVTRPAYEVILGQTSIAWVEPRPRTKGLNKAGFVIWWANSPHPEANADTLTQARRIIHAKIEEAAVMHLSTLGGANHTYPRAWTHPQ